MLVGGGLVAAGAALLMLTTGLLTLSSLALPVVLVASGLFFSWRSLNPGARDGNVIIATVTLLTGMVLAVHESYLPGTDLGTIWPLFMTIGGFSLVVYGLRKGPGYSVTWGVPGAAIVGLSLLFLLVSTDVIRESLSQLALRFWPALIIGGGLVIVVTGLRRDLGAVDGADTEEDGDSDLDERDLEH